MLKTSSSVTASLILFDLGNVSTQLLCPLFERCRRCMQLGQTGILVIFVCSPEQLRLQNSHQNLNIKSRDNFETKSLIQGMFLFQSLATGFWTKHVLKFVPLISNSFISK